MTAPKRDGRSMLERARECAKLWGYEAHDRSGEVADALRAVMPVVEAAINVLHDSRFRSKLAEAFEAILEPRETYTSGKPIRRRDAAPEYRREVLGESSPLIPVYEHGKEEPVGFARVKRIEGGAVVSEVDWNELKRCGDACPSDHNVRCDLAPGHDGSHARTLPGNWHRWPK